MAQIDLDDAGAEPRAKVSNRLALAGLIALFFISIGTAYIQSHPWQVGGLDRVGTRSTWFDDVQINGQHYQADGAAIVADASAFWRVGMTSDGREVYSRTGGGGGRGQPQLYVKIDTNYYQPVKPRAVQ